jgi:hypothetical protein
MAEGWTLADRLEARLIYQTSDTFEECNWNSKRSHRGNLYGDLKS